MTACKDCEPGSKRPAPHVGPRCVTHHRVEVKRKRRAGQEKRVRETYSLSPQEYDAILEAQGGMCFICRRATGLRKRLAVDHDHACCDGPLSCGQCVRGLLCSTCNKTHGHLRDDPEAWQRGADYLRSWPSGRGPRNAETASEPASTEERAA